MPHFFPLYNLIYRNPSVKFSDVYPREDDDDKTWRGDESWRVNAGNLNVKKYYKRISMSI